MINIQEMNEKKELENNMNAAYTMFTLARDEFYRVSKELSDYQSKPAVWVPSVLVDLMSQTTESLALIEKNLSKCTEEINALLHDRKLEWDNLGEMGQLTNVGNFHHDMTESLKIFYNDLYEALHEAGSLLATQNRENK